MAKQQFPWLNKEQIFTEEIEGVRITFKKLSFGAQRKIQGACVKTNEKGAIDIDVSLIGLMTTIEAIMDWDFTDEDGEKLPIDLHTFDEVLDPDFGGQIIKLVSDKVNTNVTEKKKKK
ncbi:hypothetical protein [Bacillus mycoides]|uniref:hypothetical protein n=1 Tax=Bacillus mycoides TaxID=1405 RepID=UPI00027C1979|nr:hypothetical protein [Bacillus mycoides]EJV59373.1 hypothetical protein IEU_05638 [Bacillus mycoides]